MNDWDFRPPPDSDLGDREVPREGDHLAGKRVALMVSGGIAAYRTPTLARALRRQGAEVVAFASDEGLRYVTRETLEWATRHPVVDRLTPAAEHLSDEQPFDAFLLAPATYNTINKLAYGIADGVLTSTLASALGRMERGEAAVLVAPTMHGSLHTSILTESLTRLDRLGVRVIPPREDYGKHNIPTDEVLVVEVCRALSNSPLKGVPVLVTGGPTPVPVDAIRRLTNRFSGRLGEALAEELTLRGAAVDWIHGRSGWNPPPHLPATIAETYDDYRRLVGERAGQARFGVFTAAVADFAPREVAAGKTPSDRTGWTIDLVPTAKVVAEARKRFPDLHMVVFKFEEGVSRERLAEIARARLAQGYQAVVANRGEELGHGDEHRAYLFVAGENGPRRLDGKREIARGIVRYLEEVARGDREGGDGLDRD